ncbi:MAG: NADH-quinone oxidoreductase subunit C [Croceibacterium sp.]
MATVLHPAPRMASNAGVQDTLAAALGDMMLAAKEEHREIVFGVERERIVDALRLLRDEHDYQQLMEIAGVDYPSRAERFEVVYMLLSLTRNHRIMVKVRAAEDTPVPSVTTLWPNAGWLEREVFDLYGVIFDGNSDLRRILTDYGFEGHPFRKDFPLTGYQELRYSEEEKRVVYQPVTLAQDFRTFEFMSPWEGADYVLPGDEKAAGVPAAPSAGAPAPVVVAKTTDTPAQTGGGAAANAKAADKVAPGDGGSRGKASQGTAQPVPKTTSIPEPGAPAPTEDRPARAPRKGKSPDTPQATQLNPRKPRPKGPAK